MRGDPRPPIILLKLRTIHHPFHLCSQLPTSLHACQHLRRKSCVQLLHRSRSQHQSTSLLLGRWTLTRTMTIAATRKTLLPSKRAVETHQSQLTVWLLRLLMVALSNRTDEYMFDVERGKMKEISSLRSLAPGFEFRTRCSNLCAYSSIAFPYPHLLLYLGLSYLVCKESATLIQFGKHACRYACKCIQDIDNLREAIHCYR